MPDNPYLFDLVQLTPPEIVFHLTPDPEDDIAIRPIFPVEDALRYNLILERRRVEAEYMEEVQKVIKDWTELANTLRDKGEDPPDPPALPEKDDSERYTVDKMQVDVFTLLRDVWNHSEKRKLKADRKKIDLDYLYSELTVSEAWNILQGLWQYRFAQRGTESVEQPITPPETNSPKESVEEVTTTVKKTRKKSVSSAA